MIPREHLELLRMVADVPFFARRKCGVQCDAQQREIFARSNRNTILNCARQTGKSTAAALMAVHTAFFRTDATIIITAPTCQQTRELMRKIRNYAFLAGASRRGAALSVELRNGSRILGVAADEDTVRCYSAVSLIIIDEASRVKDDVYFALLPMLAVGVGAMWLLSTPKGQRGFFHAEWADIATGAPTDAPKIEDWAKIRFTAHECPRISAQFLEAQKKRMGERRFAQEFECMFIDTNQGVFHPDVARGAFKDHIQPLDL